MKTIKIFLSILFTAVMLFSCRNEDDQLTLKTVNKSVLDDIPVKTFTLAEPQDGQNRVLFTVTWTETTFLLSDSGNPSPAAPVHYILEMDKKGNNFNSPTVLTSTTLLVANILLQDLNQMLLINFGAEPDTPIDLELRIRAYYGENQTNSAVSENVLSLTVTPYKPVDIIAALYLLGDMNGWNNTNTDFPFFRNSNSKDDQTYTYTGRLAANTYFKFLPEESLGTYKAYCYKDNTSLVYEESNGGAFYNEFERYVTINVNLKDLTYSITDVDVTNAKTYGTIGPIGQFCNWDNEPPMTKSSYDQHLWSGTFQFDISTAVKFRGDRNWAYNWGGKETDYPYGKGFFDGPGAAISSPGTYKIHFNDLTGHYIILQK